MSILAGLKGQKTIVVIGGVVILVLIAAYALLNRPSQTGSGEVITKRAKIELPKEEPPAAENTLPQAEAQTKAAIPETQQAPVLEKKPEIAVASGKTEQKTEKTAAAAPKPEQKPEKAAEKAAEQKTEKKAAQKASKKPPVKAEKKEASTTASAQVWALNVASFASAKEAQSLADTLKKNGYNSYLTGFVMEGTKWYRVRVGFYPTKEQAASIGKTLKQKYKLQDSWIVMPTRDERRKHSN